MRFPVKTNYYLKFVNKYAYLKHNIFIYIIYIFLINIIMFIYVIILF